MKGHGKGDDGNNVKNGPCKFVAAKVRAAHASLSQQSNPGLGIFGPPSSIGGGSIVGLGISSANNISEKDIQVLYLVFEVLI